MIQDKTNNNLDEPIFGNAVGTFNEQYLPLVYDLAGSQDDQGFSRIQNEIDGNVLSQTMNATFSTYASQLYDLCPNLIIEKRTTEDDELNHVVEIFVTLFAEPFDPELDALRQKTKRLFMAMRWILETRIKQKIPTSLKSLQHILKRYFSDTKTYAQLIIKADLARNMLKTLSVPNVSEDDKKQLYEDARTIFGISAKPTDFSQEEYFLRVSRILLNIASVGDISFSARKMLNKSYDDQINNEAIGQIAEILLPDILAQKDDTLPYLVFPDESSVRAEANVSANQTATATEQPTKTPELDVA